LRNGSITDIERASNMVSLESVHGERGLKVCFQQSEP